MNVTDTIAAVSTPRGKGGIAVIRISGADAAACLSRVFIPHGRAPVANPRRACLGKICNPAGEVVDDGIAVFYAAPASFTGEDVAEISCHGGVLLTEAVLGAVLAAGARPAEAGEFTARAVWNGKMGLSEAEALGALLEAGTKGQMALARGGLSGHLAEATRALYARLAAILADMYAKIDFPDEDLGELSREELLTALCELRCRTADLAATWQTGRAVSEGVETVICGPVNAGKSTLYNALVGHDAAIVTDIAGTTRDILTETVSVGDLTLRLSDTAGLRETADTVEQMGVARADAAIREAELVLAVLDGSRAPDTATLQLLTRLREASGTVIVLLNKSDRDFVFLHPVLADFPHVISISAAKGEIAELKTLLQQLYRTAELDLSGDAIVASARQYAALSRAEELLRSAIAALEAGVPVDAALVDAELALAAIGEVDGRAVDEDIVSEIFSHFCVGK